MRPHRRSPLGVVAGTLVVIGIVATVVIVFAQDQREPVLPIRPTGVKVTPGPISITPKVSPARRKVIVAELATMLSDLYDRAFVRKATAASPSPSAPTTPDAPIAPLFTAKAREALAAEPDVFDPGRVRITDGTLEFRGVVTNQRTTPTDAFLYVEFSAIGTVGRSVSAVSVKQKGTLLVVRAPVGWRIKGFDLHFAARTSPPTPKAKRS